MFLVGKFNMMEVPEDSLSQSNLLRSEELVDFNLLRIAQGLVDVYLTSSNLIGPRFTCSFGSGPTFTAAHLDRIYS